MARTVEEIEGELRLMDDRRSQLMAEARAAEAAERAAETEAVRAALPADWRNSVIAAVETAMSAATFNEYGEHTVCLTEAVAVNIQVDISEPFDADEDEGLDEDHRA